MLGSSSEKDFRGCLLAGHGLLLLTTPSLCASTLPSGRPITAPLHQLWRAQQLCSTLGWYGCKGPGVSLTGQDSCQ